MAVSTAHRLSASSSRTAWSLIDEAHGLMAQAEERMTAMRFMTEHLSANREPDGLTDALGSAGEDWEQFTHTAKLKIEEAMTLLSLQGQIQG